MKNITRIILNRRVVAKFGVVLNPELEHEFKRIDGLPFVVAYKSEIPFLVRIDEDNIKTLIG